MSEYGVCFIDTAIGTFFIGQFTDDRNCSRLRTVFSHYTPVQVSTTHYLVFASEFEEPSLLKIFLFQILYEKNRISPNLQELLRNLGSGVRKDALLQESEFWSGSKLLKFLAEGSYFAKKGQPFDAALDWPDNLHNLLCKSQHNLIICL